MRKIFKKLALCAASLLTLSGCPEDSILPFIPLSLNPLVLANPIAMVGSSANQRLYVVNSNNRVLWFDASFAILDITDPVNPVAIAVISIPNFSGQIVLDEPNGFVYIPDRQSSSEADDFDQVIRININEASPGFLTVDFFDSAANPFGAAFVDGVNLFVAATADALRYNVGNLAAYSQVDLMVTTNTGQELPAEQTRELMVSPSGATLFVTNEGGNMLILNLGEFAAPPASGVLDLGTEPVDYIVTGTQSTLGIQRDSTFLYVVDANPPALKIMTDVGLAPVSGPPVEISSSSLQVASIPVGNNPGEVIVDEPNGRAYVSNTGDDTVSVIDLNLQIEIGRIDVSTTPETEAEADASGSPTAFDEGDQPFGMALVNIGGTNFLYVAHFITNLISIINADTLTLLNTIP